MEIRKEPHEGLKAENEKLPQTHKPRNARKTQKLDKARKHSPPEAFGDAGSLLTSWLQISSLQTVQK